MKANCRFCGKEYEQARRAVTCGAIECKAKLRRAHDVAYVARHPEQRREASRRYREANPEAVTRSLAEWRERNPEKHRKYYVEWYRRNRESILAKRRERLASDPAIRERDREYRRRSAEKRRARERQDKAPITPVSSDANPGPGSRPGRDTTTADPPSGTPGPQ